MRPHTDQHFKGPFLGNSCRPNNKQEARALVACRERSKAPLVRTAVGLGESRRAITSFMSSHKPQARGGTAPPAIPTSLHPGQTRTKRAGEWYVVAGTRFSPSPRVFITSNHCHRTHSTSIINHITRKGASQRESKRKPRAS